MIEQVKTIRELMSRTELILQLAEEANELAMAAYKQKEPKLLQFHTNENFYEEIADVKLCIDCIGDYMNTIKPSIIKWPVCDELYDILIMNCCELSKACIKYRRTLIPGANPTPVTEDEAELKLIDTITNVKSCIDSIDYYLWNSEIVNRKYVFKANRTINRVKNKD